MIKGLVNVHLYLLFDKQSRYLCVCVWEEVAGEERQREFAGVCKPAQQQSRRDERFLYPGVYVFIYVCRLSLPGLRAKTISLFWVFQLVCKQVWLCHIFDPLFWVPIVVPLLPARDRRMRRHRCVGVCDCGCVLQLETDIVTVKLDASNSPLPSAGATEVGAVCLCAWG